jgi:hypothetical protein
MKTKKRITILLLCLFSAHLYGQKVNYSILRNEPHTVNNFAATITPIAFEYYSKAVGVAGGVSAFYIPSDKFLIDFHFNTGYTKNNNFFSAVGIDDEEYLAPYGGFKRMIATDLTIQYLLGEFVPELKVKVTIRSGALSSTYIKVPIRRLISLPIRLGLGHIRNTIGYSGYGDNVTFSGYEVRNQTVTNNSISGLSVYTANTLNIGLGIIIRDDINIRVDNGYGEKDGKLISVYFADIMLPINDEFSDVYMYERVNNTRNKVRYHINEDTPRSKFGFRVGGYTKSLEKLCVGSKWEIGVKPGPIDFRTNFYVSLGLQIGLSKMLKSFS